MGSKAKNRRASTPQVWRRCTSGAPSGDELPSPDLSVCCEPAINWSCLVHTAPPGQKNGPTGPNWVEAGRFLAEPAPYWVEHARDWDETAQVFAEPALTRVDSAPKSVKPVPSSVESARRCRPEMGRTSCGQLARAGEVWRQSAPQSKEQRWLDPATTLCGELPIIWPSLPNLWSSPPQLWPNPRRSRPTQLQSCPPPHIVQIHL